jgi:hypothetical protein
MSIVDWLFNIVIVVLNFVLLDNVALRVEFSTKERTDNVYYCLSRDKMVGLGDTNKGPIFEGFPYLNRFHILSRFELVN